MAYSNYESSGWFSEEARQVPSGPYPITDIKCRGDDCDDMMMVKGTDFDRTATLDDTTNTTTAVFNEGEFMLCPKDTLVRSIICSGGNYCQDIQLVCSKLLPGYALHGRYVHASEEFSEEGHGTGTCGASTYLIGMGCKGDHCDNKRSVYVALHKFNDQLQADPDDCTDVTKYVPYDGESSMSTVFSEEGSDTTGLFPMPFTALTCSGDLCDNLQLQATHSPNYEDILDLRESSLYHTAW
eukprot:CAMPEP_0203755570 /NCGR_PEP_ID=MMETSP0098-20131031/8994_1 /ASSEMBLY_ACC=CAM_ASM_000208 /TAXON_ID=96639 /ORGANISM=" , Strain NY0313808BC1" /LENGTH=239 /DNA_ID=CAMNT_0050647085 /DNA_START=813 /DNA_END=1530 /DNA_ORIENTATION=+